MQAIIRHRGWITGLFVCACANGGGGGSEQTGATSSASITGVESSTGDGEPTTAGETEAESEESSPVDSSEGSSEETGTPGYVCADPPVCEAAGAGPTKVELRLFGFDDAVIAEVNGLRRGFWSIPSLPGQDTGRIDVSHWFARGGNQLRLLAANTGGPGSASAQVWVDDALVLDTNCSGTTCPPGTEIPLGFFMDESVAIDSAAFPCPQQLCVHGAEEGSLYIDGAFTGARAPIEVMLPPGTYEVGVGAGTDDPPPNAGDGFVHEGRFRQRTVVLADQPSEVVLDDTDLVAPQVFRFLIVPIRNVQYTNGQTGVLADEVPGVLAEAVATASTDLTSPFSYGLVEYTADVHPMLETTVTADADGFVAIDQAALANAGLDQAAVADHDVVVWAYSAHLADGTAVGQQPCCAWGGGSQIWMHTGWVYEVPIVYYVFIHEWLHTTEDELILFGYGGTDGVHGADEHGYMSGSNGEYDFGQFYRHFIRGQVSEAGTWVGAVMGLWQTMMPAPRDPQQRFSGPVRALSIGRR